MGDATGVPVTSVNAKLKAKAGQNRDGGRDTWYFRSSVTFRNLRVTTLRLVADQPRHVSFERCAEYSLWSSIVGLSPPGFTFLTVVHRQMETGVFCCFDRGRVIAAKGIRKIKCAE